MNTKEISNAEILRYKQHLFEEEKSELTIRKYLRDLNKFILFSENTCITKETVICYKQYLIDHYAAASVNSMIASINSFFLFQGWNDLCAKQLRIQKKPYVSTKKELTKSEYFQLVHMANKMKNNRLYYLLQTLGATGIRISELHHFTIESIKKGEVCISCKGKTRVILIPTKLKQALLQYGQKSGIKSGQIFITKRGKPLDRSNIWREMKKLCRKAGVSCEKVTPHNLRKLFARCFYESKKDIARLADVLGHSSINTTRIYIMSTGTEHRKEIERLGLIL